MGEDSFQRHFTDLLTLFSKDLSSDVILNTQIQSVDWIEVQRHVISQRFLAILIPTGENSLAQLPLQQGNDHLVLERYLERLGPPIGGIGYTSPLLNPGFHTTFDPDDPSSGHLYLHNGKDVKDYNDHDFETRTEHLESLILQSSAFEKLKRNLHWINKPYKCDVDGCDRYEGFSRTNELEQHKISKHGIVTRKSRTGNLVDKLRAVYAFLMVWIIFLGLIIRKSTIVLTNGREKPCLANMVRGQWICVSLETLFQEAKVH